jgi:hypothetical protein
MLCWFARLTAGLIVASVKHRVGFALRAEHDQRPSFPSNPRSYDMNRPKSLFKQRQRERRGISLADPDGLNDPRYIATHEAGHAVAAVVLGFKLKSVDIKRRPLLGGKVSVGLTDTGPVNLDDVAGKGEDAAMPHLVLTFAGYMAEGYVNPRVYEGGGYHQDLEDTRRTAAAACCALTERKGGGLEVRPEELRRNRDRLTALLTSASTTSNELVQQHWSAIEEVAALLLKSQRLSGAEVEVVVQKHKAS